MIKRFFNFQLLQIGIVLSMVIFLSLVAHADEKVFDPKIIDPNASIEIAKEKQKEKLTN